MALPPVLSKIVGWLRAGYPEGVPRTTTSRFSPSLAAS